LCDNVNTSEVTHVHEGTLDQQICHSLYRVAQKK